MSTPTVTRGPFVPSRFMERQLYVIGVGSALVISVFIVWPRLTAWLLTADFLPHAYCYLGNPRLVWSHVVADSLVAFAYLAIAIATREHPDLVLMDIRLKGAKDGVQAAKEIHEQMDVPLVYLTAHSDQLTVDRAKRTHYDGFILKPFRARELQSTIEIAMQRHAMRTKQGEQ